mgnify:CR=1 FL=1
MVNKWVELKNWVNNELNGALKDQAENQSGNKFMPDWEKEMLKTQIQTLYLVKNRMINLEEKVKTEGGF